MKVKEFITLFISLVCCISLVSAQKTKEHKKETPSASSQKKIDSTKTKVYYLELKATVHQSKGDEQTALDSVLMVVYVDDIPFSEVWTNKKGKASVKIPLNQKRKIEFSKPGYVSKSIAVNTKVPEIEVNVYSFNCDVDLFEEVEGLDVSILKEPIARVSYSTAESRFQYDMTYTNKINVELKKMYKKYYALQAKLKAAMEKDSVKKSNHSQPVKEKVDESQH